MFVGTALAALLSLGLPLAAALLVRHTFNNTEATYTAATTATTTQYVTTKA